MNTRKKFKQYTKWQAWTQLYLHFITSLCAQLHSVCVVPPRETEFTPTEKNGWNLGHSFKKFKLMRYGWGHRAFLSSFYSALEICHVKLHSVFLKGILQMWTSHIRKWPVDDMHRKLFTFNTFHFFPYILISVLISSSLTCNPIWGILSRSVRIFDSLVFL